MTALCELCNKPLRKSHKSTEELMVIDGQAVTFIFHDACKKGIDWYVEMKSLARKGKRGKRPLKSQSTLKGDK